jgi:lyso-ornithine lipid O-acyltransferase
VGRLRAAIILFCFVCFTLPLMPLQQFLVWFWPRMARRFPMHYHRILLRILGVHVHVAGKPLLQGPAILAANHVSWLDIVVMSSVAPVSFIAKQDVAGWPFFGQLARLQRTLFVDRDRRHSTSASRDEMARRLAEGDILVLFAEGTSGDGASVKAFKSAFFSLAEQARVSVQPVSIVYTGHRNLPMTRRQRPLYAWYGDMDLPPHLWRALSAGPVEIEVVCHAPLAMADAGNRKALAKTVENTIRQGLVHALHGRPETR